MMLHLIKRPAISQWSHLVSQQQSTKHMTITVATLKSPLLFSQGPYPNHIHPRNTLVIDHIGLSPSKKNCFIFSNKSPLKVMKNAFYFILKAFFVLKRFNFCLDVLVI